MGSADLRYDDDTPTTTYNFEVESNLWTRWKNTVPRDVPLAVQLRALIANDYRASVSTASADDEATAALLASRIRIRAIQAANAVGGEEVDAETASEQLSEIIDLADAIES